jgi:hypothetical protein
LRAEKIGKTIRIQPADRKFALAPALSPREREKLGSVGVPSYGSWKEHQNNNLDG